MTKEGAIEVGGNHLAPSGEGEGGDGFVGSGDAGIVDEHVEAAALADKGGELGDGFGVANVAGDGCGVGQARGKAGERALAAGGEDEMVAAFGKG